LLVRSSTLHIASFRFVRYTRMRVLLPLKKKGNHQHQHLEDYQEEEGEEQQHLEEQQQQQPFQVAEEASYSYTEPGSDPATTSCASALSVESTAASPAVVVPAATAAVLPASVPAAASTPASPRSLLATTSSSYTEPPEPSKKRARTESITASALANGNSKPAARRSVSDPVPPVLPLPSGNSDLAGTETNSQTMAGGRYPQDPDDAFASATAAATRASLTTASTTASTPTTATASLVAAATTTPLENEPPPNMHSNESNKNMNIYYNYQSTNNSHGITTNSNSQSVARSAASASNCSNGPAANEYDGDNNVNNSISNNDQVSESFRKDLKKQGLEIVEQEGDGNCLFRAVSLQVYGDSSMHADVRQQCLDFMARDVEHFGQFVVGEDFGDYIARKRQDGVHGNHTEIQAVSELFNRPVEVFTPASAAKPLNIFHAEYKTADAPIRLSYHDGNHYNAVIDPLVPTAGLGLGLPGLKPGLADQLQVAKAVTESDQLADDMELERVLKESARDNDDLQRALKESAYDSQMQMDKVRLLIDEAMKEMKDWYSIDTMSQGFIHLILFLVSFAAVQVKEHESIRLGCHQFRTGTKGSRELNGIISPPRGGSKAASITNTGTTTAWSYFSRSGRRPRTESTSLWNELSSGHSAATSHSSSSSGIIRGLGCIGSESRFVTHDGGRISPDCSRTGHEWL
jgi:hypothetical protein